MMILLMIHLMDGIFQKNKLDCIISFKLGINIKYEFRKLIKEISYFGGNVEIRIIRFNAIDREIYTGDQKGKITVWSLKSGQSIYAWKAHNGAITQMEFFPKSRQLLSMAKDKKIIYWQLPDNWVKDEIKKFQDENIREINDKKAMERLQKQKEKGDDDSSDDSLDGWDIPEK